MRDPAWSNIPYSYPHFQASIMLDFVIASQTLAPPLLERLNSPSRAYNVILLYGKIMVDLHLQLMKIEVVDDHHGKERQEAH